MLDPLWQPLLKVSTKFYAGVYIQFIIKILSS